MVGLAGGIQTEAVSTSGTIFTGRSRSTTVAGITSEPSMQLPESKRRIQKRGGASMSETYVDDVLSGSAPWTDIDDYIERWHNDEGSGSIQAALGMSRHDYGLFVEEPRSLRFILAAHEGDESVEDLLAKSDDRAIAARGLDPADAKRVRDWLVKTGRLS